MTFKILTYLIPIKHPITADTGYKIVIYKDVTKGTKKPIKVAKMIPKTIPGKSNGNKTPKHIPMTVNPKERTYSALVASGIFTDVKIGSRNANASVPAVTPVAIPA